MVSSRIGSGQPGLGVGYELDAIAAAVIGGTSLSAGGIGTVAGTIVGALIIGVLNNTLDLMNVSAYFQQIIKGCIIVGAVIIDQLKQPRSASSTFSSVAIPGSACKAFYVVPDIIARISNRIRRRGANLAVGNPRLWLDSRAIH